MKDGLKEEVIQEALNKQKPLKVISEKVLRGYALGSKKPSYDTYYQCGSCGKYVTREKYKKDNYCSHCGQKIDWNEVKE